MKINTVNFKLVFTILFITLLSLSCQQNKEIPHRMESHDGYTISGSVYNTKANTLYLVDAQENIVDSSLITNDVFQLKGTLNKSGAYHLVVDNTPQAQTIYLENTNFNVLINQDEMMITGGTLNTKLNAYNNKVALHNTQRINALNRYSSKSITNKELLASLDSITEIQAKGTVAFIEDNQDNLLSSIGFTSLNLSLDSALSLAEKTKDAKNNLFTSALNDQLVILQKEEDTRVAAIKKAEEIKAYRAPAPYFTAESLTGSDLEFSNVLAGKKAVLIDFWASWCKPCRMITPQVRNVYHKYKDQGFDVITVSLDRNRAAWKQGVLEDQMSSWNHVYDEYKYIASLYGARSIPHMVLVDAEGKIIKDKISITQLKSELTTIFKK